MSLSEATLKKLSKDEVINLLLDYKNKFETTMNTDLSSLRQDLSVLKQNYFIQVNNKLEEHIVSTVDEILRIVTCYRARDPNAQLLNSQNEKMQTEFATARKT